MAHLDKEALRVVGRNVLRIRGEKGITQHQLAERSGLSRSTIAAVEGHKYKSADYSTIVALAHGLGVPEEDLKNEPNGAGPSAAIAEEFLESDWAKVVQPTEAEVRWLTAVPLVFWEGMRPDPETVADILRVRRQHPET